MVRASGDKTGTWWKIILAIVGMGLTVILTVWGVSITRAEVRGTMSEKVVNLEKFSVQHVELDKGQNIRLDHVESDVVVLKERAAITETTQKNILDALTKQENSTKEVKDKLDRILQRLPYRGGGPTP